MAISIKNIGIETSSHPINNGMIVTVKTYKKSNRWTPAIVTFVNGNPKTCSGPSILVELAFEFTNSLAGWSKNASV